jgi:hypothetical protein
VILFTIIRMVSYLTQEILMMHPGNNFRTKCCGFIIVGHRYLQLLKNDADLRHKMGQAGKEAVKKCTIQVYYD